MCVCVIIIPVAKIVMLVFLNVMLMSVGTKTGSNCSIIILAQGKLRYLRYGVLKFIFMT